MREIRFEMRPVEKKRTKLVGRKSKYDPMIDQFIEGGEDLVEISVEDKDSSYVASQLKNRIERRELDIDVSATQGLVYLEKKKPEPA